MQGVKQYSVKSSNYFRWIKKEAAKTIYEKSQLKLLVLVSTH